MKMKLSDNKIKKVGKDMKSYEYSRKLRHIAKVSGGFTLVELVSTIAILGVLAAVAIPKFSNLTQRTQAERNITNIHVIRETFFQYYFRQHMQGNPHFPPAPNNGVGGYMDLIWANASMTDDPQGPTPASLFGDSKVPFNSMGNPFYYEVTVTIDDDGVPNPTMTLKDLDPDSPTFNKTFSFSL